MDYIIDIKPLQDQGLSNSEIVSHLNAKTMMPMDPDQSRYILQDSGAVLSDPVMVDQRSGSLISYYQSLPDGDVKNLIAFFLSRVYSGEQVRTDEYPRSVQFKAVEDALPENLKFVSANLVESAGGRPYSVTEDDVVASKTTWEQEQAEIESQREEQRQAEEQYQQDLETANGYSVQAQTLWNQNIAPLQDSNVPVTDPAIWQAALQAVVDGWSN